MRASEGLRGELLDRVPDDPVWIEARAALLDSKSRLYGDPRDFVVRSDGLRLGAIVGRASESLIREALSDIADAGSDPTALWAVVMPAGFTRDACSAMSGWRADEASIFSEPNEGGVSTQTASANVRLMRRSEAVLLEDLPEALAAELNEVFDRSEVAAAWVDGRPVSFCYIACESEKLWDISINTVAAYRRRGLAGDCVRWLAATMAKRGKRAVWGAHSENVASRRLAEKLGFEPSGRLCLFENSAGEQQG